ncbi:hypothetical protein H8E50_07245 [bacterium]|nr:hypothetical protein [bacterium]
MIVKNYAIIFRIIKSSNFLKTQALTLFIITYIDWTIIPFLTKLEGTYLPIYMISFYMLIGAMDGFIQPLFKNIKIYHIFLFAIMLDITQIASYLLINDSIILFTYTLLSIFTIQGITFEIARVHTVDFMVEESVDLKDYLMIRSLMISSAIVAGALSAMIFDHLTKDLKILLIYLSILGIIGIYLQGKLYRKFKKRVLNSKIQVEKNKKELYKKFRI